MESTFIFQNPKKAIPCQYSGSGQVTLSNFPEILLKSSLPHMMNICKIWIKSVKKWHDYKAFQLGVFSWEGAEIVHIWPCLKPYYCQTTLVNKPNFSGMLVTLPNIEKITLSTLWLSKFKGHGHSKLTVSSSCYKFSKTFKPRHSFISWYFSLIFGRIVADKIFFDLRKIYCKISKGWWDILGQTWHDMKKLEKWGTSVASVTHDRSKNLRWKNFHIVIMIWQVYQMVLNVFIEKKFDKVYAKTTNFVIQRS